jgi:predicted DNA-binding ribbon-helix-helix protein
VSSHSILITTNNKETTKTKNFSASLRLPIFSGLSSNALQ